MTTFEMRIELGNAAMQTPPELADAIEGVAERVRDGVVEGKIRDLNGNTVGSWILPEGYPPEEED